VSPVIILGLVLMWAVVLVPMWLRRHDEVDQSRSVDKFSAAMHTLSRGEDRPAARNVQTPHRAAVLDVHVSGASAPEALAERRRRRQARRRGRLLSLLLIVDVAVLTGAFVVGGSLVWAGQIVLDVAVVLFFTHLRRTAVRAEAARRRAAARRRDSAELEALEREPVFERTVPSRYEAPPAWEEGITVFRAGTASASTAATTSVDGFFDQTALADEPELDGALAADFDEAVALVTEPRMPQVRVSANDGFFDQEIDLTAAEKTIDLTAAERRAEPAPHTLHSDRPEHSERAARAAAAAAAEVEAVGGKPWEPIPVPRPTYATKPAAPSYPAVPRRSEPLLPPVERAAQLEDDDDLEAILDRRWAVND
jgi:hypothetical protein